MLFTKSERKGSGSGRGHRLWQRKSSRSQRRHIGDRITTRLVSGHKHGDITAAHSVTHKFKDLGDSIHGSVGAPRRTRCDGGFLKLMHHDRDVAQEHER